MTRAVRLLLVAAGTLAIAATLAVAGLAARADTPFYQLPPSPRKECHNVKHCLSVIGPWVVVPAHGAVSFMLECPKKRHAGFVGGTDTRASSSNVHVWFDGQIGSPIKQSVTTGAFLLFHAVTNNGQAGVFEPVIGCITLREQSSGRATVSARQAPPLPGKAAGTPLDLRSSLLVLIAGTTQKTSTNCPRNEDLVGNWSALAFATENPPSLAHVSAVSTRTVVTGNKVSATVRTDRSLPFAPLAEIQLGAICAR